MQTSAFGSCKSQKIIGFEKAVGAKVSWMFDKITKVVFSSKWAKSSKGLRQPIFGIFRHFCVFADFD